MNLLAMKLRAKKLGVLIRDVRLASGKSVEDCAKMIGVSAETLTSYELGSLSPSLPELELLAYHLNTPLEHFWGDRSIATDSLPARQIDLEQLMGLRQRMIGACLRKARLEADLSLVELAERSGIAADLLEAYEFGQQPIPLPTLEALGEGLSLPIKECFDKNGPIGKWAAQQRMLHDIMHLPPELQEFVSKPVNQPYLELAQRLSEMSVEKLRSVAEGLLEITL